MEGAVCCPQALACEVGAQVLEEGGNAVDAAVATAFTQMVADPFMCGVGGQATALVYVPGHGVINVNGWARVGSLATAEMWAEKFDSRTDVTGWMRLKGEQQLGYDGIMLPGAVAAFGEMHRRWGRVPWRAGADSELTGLRPHLSRARRRSAEGGVGHSLRRRGGDRRGAGRHRYRKGGRVRPGS